MLGLSGHAGDLREEAGAWFRGKSFEERGGGGGLFFYSSRWIVMRLPFANRDLGENLGPSGSGFNGATRDMVT